jgi:LPXTG-motif cell wall-anchored protein
MKKIAAICIAALGAALLVFTTAPAASAYPELTCKVKVDRQTLKPGESFTVTGDARIVDDEDESTEGISWTFKWNGVTKHRTGGLVKASFTAPEVSSTRKIRLTAKADTPRGPCVHHFDITVLGQSVAGPGGGDDGVLPDTGGPAFWLLVAALLMLLGGGVMVARKRSTS